MGPDCHCFAHPCYATALAMHTQPPSPLVFPLSRSPTPDHLPSCAACDHDIEGDVTKALSSVWHPECFACQNCGEVSCCSHPLALRTFDWELYRTGLLGVADGNSLPPHPPNPDPNPNPNPKPKLKGNYRRCEHICMHMDTRGMQCRKAMRWKTQQLCCKRLEPCKLGAGMLELELKLELGCT